MTSSPSRRKPSMSSRELPPTQTLAPNDSQSLPRAGPVRIPKAGIVRRSGRWASSGVSSIGAGRGRLRGGGRAGAGGGPATVLVVAPVHQAVAGADGGVLRGDPQRRAVGVGDADGDPVAAGRSLEAQTTGYAAGPAFVDSPAIPVHERHAGAAGGGRWRVHAVGVPALLLAAVRAEPHWSWTGRRHRRRWSR